jgi:hypothetical protein
MNRTAVLNWLKTAGFDALCAECDRTMQDGAAGVGPALDNAFYAYGAARALPGDPLAADVPLSDWLGFQDLLKLHLYNLLIPTLQQKVDTSVDAPLTNAKLSQMFRAVVQERDNLAASAAAYGYGVLGTSAFVAGFDYLEPGTGARGEYAPL